ncbi:MAG: HDOD domain-containing protein [Oxalobacter sp.]|nr:MAG: HDOD domain-containing protein [Oxalobacter sp.]
MPHAGQDIRKRLLVVRLPPLPHILLKLIEYCRTERVGIAEIAELVSKDPAVAAKILGVANSSAYYRPGQKIRLEQSLMTLGTDMIRTLVISESVFQTLSHLTTSASVNLCKFWQHSLTNAVLARDVARKTGYPNIDEAYLCGLLHDVGRIAFLAVSPNKYAPYFMADDDNELCALEQKELQITHQEAGAWMADRWKLGQNVADSILYHHEPVTRIEKTSLLVRVVYLSHVLSCHSWDAPEVMDAARLCSLIPDDLKPIQDGAAQKVHEAAEFLGIDLEPGADSVLEKTRTQSSSVQRKLKDELHHVVQASETERNFSKQTSETGLLRTIAQSANILFDISDAIILMLDAPNQVLNINPNLEHQQQWAGFSLRLKRGGEIAASVAEKRPVFINQSNHSTPEEPLMKLLHADAIASIPLITEGECVGVLTGKVLPMKIPELQNGVRFLQVFGAQAASALLGLRRKQEEMRTLTANAVDEFKLSSRKIAHEANNPLTVIRNYLTVLNEKLRKQQPIGSEITILNEEIERVSKIIRKFVDPQPTLNQEPANVNQIIDDISRMLRESGFAPPSIKITTKSNPHASATEYDDGKIWQILLNLLKNAIEAMPNGGDVLIANQGHVNLNGRLYINLAVKDTGSGIPSDVLEKMFMPVSSKKGGEHQGLGLAIVQDLVKDINGFINCRSSSNGTSFEILVPVRSEKGNPAPPVTAS